MTRPTLIEINTDALIHNARHIKKLCPNRQVIAMVKANAYGCGLRFVIPTLENEVDAFGVACLEEAIALRALSNKPCILFQGIFSKEELNAITEHQLQCVIHHEKQLQWILETPLSKSLTVWIKVDTGMHRLGFSPTELDTVFNALKQCSWINDDIGLMTHIACADEPNHPQNAIQFQMFENIIKDYPAVQARSIANSAWILTHAEQTFEAVRPGIMLYGVSPFGVSIGSELGLKPVMHFISTVSVIHYYPPNSPIGYGGTWKSAVACRIGVVAAGYGDGYPRHVDSNATVWIKGHLVPIVGRVSMDMLTIDLTQFPDIEMGDRVELWGEHLPVERVAEYANTIAYELMCQISLRVREQSRKV